MIQMEKTKCVWRNILDANKNRYKKAMEYCSGCDGYNLDCPAHQDYIQKNENSRKLVLLLRDGITVEINKWYRDSVKEILPVTEVQKLKRKVNRLLEWIVK